MVISNFRPIKMDLADVGNYTLAFYEKKVVFLRHMSIKMLFSLSISFVVIPAYLSDKSLVTGCVVTESIFMILA